MPSQTCLVKNVITGDGVLEVAADQLDSLMRRRRRRQSIRDARRPSVRSIRAEQSRAPVDNPVGRACSGQQHANVEAGWPCDLPAPPASSGNRIRTNRSDHPWHYHPLPSPRKPRIAVDIAADSHTPEFLLIWGGERKRQRKGETERETETETETDREKDTHKRVHIHANTHIHTQAEGDRDRQRQRSSTTPRFLHRSACPRQEHPRVSQSAVAVAEHQLQHHHCWQAPHQPSPTRLSAAH